MLYGKRDTADVIKHHNQLTLKYEDYMRLPDFILWCLNKDLEIRRVGSQRFRSWEGFLVLFSSFKDGGGHVGSL